MQGNSNKLSRHNVHCRGVVQGNFEQLTRHYVNGKASQGHSFQLSNHNVHCEVVQGNSMQITRLNSAG